MNIIIDPDQVEQFREKYTVLELDTIRISSSNQLVTAYCIVENIPVLELPLVESHRKLHHNLLENYRKKDWNFCQQAIDQLKGRWGGEVDSFYEDLRSRLVKYEAQDPGDAWDGIIEKNPS
jgi:hypothetical protein